MAQNSELSYIKIRNMIGFTKTIQPKNYKYSSALTPNVKDTFGHMLRYSIIAPIYVRTEDVTNIRFVSDP